MRRRQDGHENFRDEKGNFAGSEPPLRLISVYTLEILTKNLSSDFDFCLIPDSVCSVYPTRIWKPDMYMILFDAGEYTGSFMKEVTLMVPVYCFYLSWLVFEP